jgi:hypothetical protein
MSTLISYLCMHTHKHIQIIFVMRWQQAISTLIRSRHMQGEQSKTRTMQLVIYTHINFLSLLPASPPPFSNRASTEP